jgi:RNA polymerase sigma-70 factor (ECF subfamily)
MEAALISESNGAIFSCSVDNVADRSEQRLAATRGNLLPGFGNFFEDYRGSMLDAGKVRDELLVLAAKRGDHYAFEMLVYRHRAKMLRTAMRFTRNTADTEDVVQVGFQKAFMHLQQFEGHSSFSTWLTSIVRNEARMFLRKRGSKVEIPLVQPNAENGADLSLDFGDLSQNAEYRCLQQEQKEILSAAINELKPGIRRTVELRILGELSTAEVAGIMGLSVSAVKSRVLRGRRQLETIVKRRMSHRRGFNVSCEQTNSGDAVASVCS